MGRKVRDYNVRMGDNAIKHFVRPTDLTLQIADVLTSWPLYRSLLYTAVSDPFGLPETVGLYCDRCAQATTWETYIGSPSNTSRSDFRGWKSKEYTCRNCKGSVIEYLYYWAAPDTEKKKNGVFFKYGQFPQLREDIPLELKRQLDPKNVILYQNSVRCRNQDMGLAAVAYLRRVVENKINDLLDMIAAEANDYHFLEAELKKLDEVKKSYRFTDKIAYASVILPPSLRPGNHNPINQLHDLSSEGLHGRPDEECLEIYDASKPVFEYLFREIDLRKQSAAKYAEHLTKLATSRKPRADKSVPPSSS